MIATSLREAYNGRFKDGKTNGALKAAFQLLRDQKGKDNEAREAMRKKVYAVVSAQVVKNLIYSDQLQVWMCLSQTRNELKRRAKQVIEQAFDLGGLTVAQRTEAALWLVETHPPACDRWHGHTQHSKLCLRGN